MVPGGLRRSVMVGVAYVVGAWLVLGLAGWLRGVLALPGLFTILLRWGLGGGLLVALLLAWHYPKLGHDGRVGAETPRP